MYFKAHKKETRTASTGNFEHIYHFKLVFLVNLKHIYLLVANGEFEVIKGPQWK